MRQALLHLLLAQALTAPTLHPPLSGLLPPPCLVFHSLRKADRTQQPPLHVWCFGVCSERVPTSSPCVGTTVLQVPPLLCLTAGRCLCDLLSLCVCHSKVTLRGKQHKLEPLRLFQKDCWKAFLPHSLTHLCIHSRAMRGMSKEHQIQL